jgi:hypothetical protein
VFTPFGERLLDVGAGPCEAQMPAGYEHDDVWWEAETGEGGSRRGAGREHESSSWAKPAFAGGAPPTGRASSLLTTGQW